MGIIYKLTQHSRILQVNKLKETEALIKINSGFSANLVCKLNYCSTCRLLALIFLDYINRR